LWGSFFLPRARQFCWPPFSSQGLTKLLSDNAPRSMSEQKFESYFGRKIAIDASMSIYQFLVRSRWFRILFG
jgi:hypothetical protein